MVSGENDTHHLRFDVLDILLPQRSVNNQLSLTIEPPEAQVIMFVY